MENLILMPLLIAIITGIFIASKQGFSDKEIAKIGLIGTTLTSLSVFFIVNFCNGQKITLLRLNDIIDISLKIDGLSIIFAMMVSILWVFACIYASKYMTHDGGFKKFYTYYTLTFAVVLGLAFSENMFTMYLFYEGLTFITLPLVTHNNKERDKFAGNKYIFYSILGAALAFSGMMIFIAEYGVWNFELGGATPYVNTNILIAYVLMFIGFGVKSGIFPFHRWLVGAGVAPTTVTALLHAVAVVKAGAFAVMRVTYYLYDYTLIKDTFAQYIVLSLSILTIFIGSSMAMKSKHLKRRLAYSTMSQLSYILLAISSMSMLGLLAGVFHMIAHAFVKIVLFYGVGNIIFANHKDYIRDIQGYAKKMPITFITFTICSLSLIGIPPFAGFFSKFAIAQSLFSMQNSFSFWGVLVLIISALLTAMYLLQIVMLGYIPYADFDVSSTNSVKEAPKEMTYTLIGITCIVVLVSIFSDSVYNLLENLILGGVL